jgi:hypothetical protein
LSQSDQQSRPDRTDRRNLAQQFHRSFLFPAFSRAAFRSLSVQKVTDIIRRFS